MNDALNFIRKAYELNKNGFENIYATLGTLQDQTQEATLRMVKESPLFPEPAQKMMQSGFDACKKGRVAFRDHIDKGQKAFEKMLNTTDKTEKTEKA